MGGGMVASESKVGGDGDGTATLEAVHNTLACASLDCGN